jgi:hypothetical protein
MKVLTGWKKVQLSAELREIAGPIKYCSGQVLLEDYLISIFICACHDAKIPIISHQIV